MMTPAAEKAPPAEGPRKANLGDAMILIVTFAVGLAIALRPLSVMGEWYSMIKPAHRLDAGRWWTAVARKMPPQFLLIQGCVQVAACFVAPLIPALIVARLRRPRPGLRRIACQPGFVACVALCLSALIVVDAAYFDLVLMPPLIGALLPGAMVLASWVALWVFRSWKPEAGWIDRLGRLVGEFWLLMIPWSIWVST
jgi:hypothetical protein